ncbi:unnamed protein product [Prorocentrum cordatum]|uniref:DNA-directed DNA polymerase n=1 Tax=Prorocentrum cordatum TaxID=2364126 RepID=A0ABN9X3X9_9DINO|nr:unnamed protein product [Polarella glacialis]
MWQCGQCAKKTSTAYPNFAYRAECRVCGSQAEAKKEVDDKQLEFAKYVLEPQKHEHGAGRTAWPQDQPQLLECAAIVDQAEAAKSTDGNAGARQILVRLSDAERKLERAQGRIDAIKLEAAEVQKRLQDEEAILKGHGDKKQELEEAPDRAQLREASARVQAEDLELWTANTTAWSSVERLLDWWVVDRGGWPPDVVCFQEHRVKLESKRASARRAARARGYRATLGLARSTGDGPVHSSGGTGVVVDGGSCGSGLPSAPLPQPQIACGAAQLGIAAASLGGFAAPLNSVGLTGPNVELLESLLREVLSWRFPWVILGGWNLDPRMVHDWARVAGGTAASTGRPKCGANELDYAVVSRALSELVDDAQWMEGAPMHPHYPVILRLTGVRKKAKVQAAKYPAKFLLDLLPPARPAPQAETEWDMGARELSVGEAPAEWYAKAEQHLAALHGEEVPAGTVQSRADGLQVHWIPLEAHCSNSVRSRSRQEARRWHSRAGALRRLAALATQDRTSGEDSPELKRQTRLTRSLQGPSDPWPTEEALAGLDMRKLTDVVCFGSNGACGVLPQAVQKDVDRTDDEDRGRQGRQWKAGQDEGEGPGLPAAEALQTLLDDWSPLWCKASRERDADWGGIGPTRGSLHLPRAHRERFMQTFAAWGACPCDARLWELITVFLAKEDGGMRPIRLNCLWIRLWSRLRQPLVKQRGGDLNDPAFWGSEGTSRDAAGLISNSSASFARIKKAAAEAGVVDLAKSHEHVSHAELAFGRRAIWAGAISDGIRTNGTLTAGCSCATVVAKLLLNALTKWAQTRRPAARCQNIVDDVFVQAVGGETQVKVQLPGATVDLARGLVEKGITDGKLHQLRLLAAKAAGRPPAGCSVGIRLKAHPRAASRDPWILRATELASAGTSTLARGLVTEAVMKTCWGAASGILIRGRPWNLRRCPAGACRLGQRGAGLGMPQFDALGAPGGEVIRLRDFSPGAAEEIVRRRACQMSEMAALARLRRAGTWATPLKWPPLAKLLGPKSVDDAEWTIGHQRALRSSLGGSHWSQARLCDEGKTGSGLRAACRAERGTFWHRRFACDGSEARRLARHTRPEGGFFSGDVFIDGSDFDVEDDSLRRAGWAIVAFNDDREITGAAPLTQAPLQEAPDGEDCAFKMLARLGQGPLRAHCDCKGTARCARDWELAAREANERRHLLSARWSEMGDQEVEVVRIKAHLGVNATTKHLEGWRRAGNAAADRPARRGARLRGAPDEARLFAAARRRRARQLARWAGDLHVHLQERGSDSAGLGADAWEGEEEHDGGQHDAKGGPATSRRPPQRHGVGAAVPLQATPGAPEELARGAADRGAEVRHASAAPWKLRGHSILARPRDDEDAVLFCMQRGANAQVPWTGRSSLLGPRHGPEAAGLAEARGRLRGGLRPCPWRQRQGPGQPRALTDTERRMWRPALALDAGEEGKGTPVRPGYGLNWRRLHIFDVARLRGPPSPVEAVAWERAAALDSEGSESDGMARRPRRLCGAAAAAQVG